MELSEITRRAGAHKRARRVGRGRASGRGKTCGRGHKGCGQRAGGGVRKLTEGGQMPLFRRIPKRGFSNARFKTVYDVINVCDLDEIFENGDQVTKQAMAKAGLLRHDRVLVKILGDGDLVKKLTVEADKFSKTAREKIAAAGGAVKELAESK